MISIERLHAGDSYQYLLRSVADGEGHKLGPAASPMTRYYTEAGTPPGRWMGSGLAGLGCGRGLAADSTVTAAAMERLFKYGTDPVSGGALTRRSFNVPRSYAERVDARIAELPTGLGRGHRAAAIEAIKAEERARKIRRPVAGFDLTFSPPKSVSALWGLSDQGTREQIAGAHYDAIEDVISMIERDVARTRIGTDGVAQMATRGVVAAAFDHYDSRAGDPQLHTHVVIANRVQGVDGVWRTLDSRGGLFPAIVALSETYNALLADRLTARLGLSWETRGTARKVKNTRWELADIPEALIRAFSRRADAIESAADALVAEWTATHGRRPDDATVLRLRQQATLATRPHKQVRSLAELSASWRVRAEELLRTDALRWAGLITASARRRVAAGRGPAILRADDLAGDVVEALATEVLERLVAERSTWRRWNVSAEAARVTMRFRMASPWDRDQLITSVVEGALARSLLLTPPQRAHVPTVFKRPDGATAFSPASAHVFTTSAILEAERRLQTASQTTTGPRVDLHLAVTVGAAPTPAGYRLADDQVDAVCQVATSGRTVDVLVGPAGSGKTTTLVALLHAWEAAHGTGSVVGLAPSAIAAQTLADSLGIDTDNTAKWLTEHQRVRTSTADQPGQTSPDGSRTSPVRQRVDPRAQTGTAGIAPQNRWTFCARQLVIIDEASLAGTLALDHIVAHATSVGAKVLLVGDWAQLSAVDAGGAFGLLVRDREVAPELVGVRRFTQAWESAASVKIRVGDTAALATYTERGRIVEGEHDEMLGAAYAAWTADQRTGKRSLLIAGDNATVRALNDRARSDLVAAGLVERAGVQLHDDTHAGVGDRVVTRRNERTLVTGSRGWVKNGDLWDVVARHDDGSVAVRRTTGGSVITLAAAYVAEYLELAYATTAHRAQGVTVDTAHAIVTGGQVTREVIYVAMTRGRESNRVYVCTDRIDREHDGAPEDAARTGAEVLAMVLRNRGAVRSAHETIHDEQERQHTISQLAAEYDTIARHALAHQWTSMLTSVGIPVPDDTSGYVHAGYQEFARSARRAAAAGLSLEGSLTGLAVGLPTDPTDAAQRLAQRVDGWTAIAASDGTPEPRTRIAGLIPSAKGVQDPDMRAALEDRAELLEQRAVTLAERAIAANAAWLAALGPRPAEPLARNGWERCAATVAAFRERHASNHPTDPLGPPDGLSWTYRSDRYQTEHAIVLARSLAGLTEFEATPAGDGGHEQLARPVPAGIGR